MPHSADSEFDGFSECSYNDHNSIFSNFLSSLSLHPHNRIVVAAMPICFRRKTMSLLLSALVLGWGFLPPGVQHAHAGGNDSTHRHSDCHEVAHHDSHDHDSNSRNHYHETLPDTSLVVGSLVHLHWQFLGIEFSMPAPKQPANGGDDQDTPTLAVVQVINEAVPNIQLGPSLGRVFLAAACSLSTDVVRDLEPVPRSPNLVTSTPLCDSARFERSGVLLA